ncbi:NAD(P)/FAD-dependent oxidoreductase [Chengkuizengella sediminis]|uniref:NAD(P)/FAD-dependent oxidoreductase n=1 Tax=Chengkuizengella sediminis TaxID=1885917 RepID=UPI00138A127E|nr:NAD(P)/FAD-dependent oxidoreductase [Chengkuizengella sediminis]NDI36787.1 NAD(P)/FAD-dependent oxidoreductase [Chengkuizengella sediminis]
MKNIVILGGGYGGLSTVIELLNDQFPDDAHITLVDRMPYQGLKTEYYALASGTISDMAIRVQYPIDSRLTVKYGEIIDVNIESQLVHLQNDDPISYDQLVIALGCTDRYHGIPGADIYTNSIQSLSATRRTYQEVNDIKPNGQVTIVGGGLSGVEIAAELRESRPDLNVRILDRGDSILSSFPKKLQSYVRAWFEEHDIEMRGNICVTEVEPNIIHNQSEKINTDITVWTAGIQPVELVQNLDFEKDSQGRVILNEYHQVPSKPNVYVVGDCASLPFSPSAQAAEAQGKQVAEVIQAIWREETPKLGKIKLKGVLGSLGKKEGFGVMGKKTVMIGRVPRVLKSGVLWMSKNHFG